MGTLFAEVFLGGRLSDWLTAKLAKKNNGVRLPEMRLWLIYPAGLLSALGLIIWGISVDQGYHWIGTYKLLFQRLGRAVSCRLLKFR